MDIYIVKILQDTQKSYDALGDIKTKVFATEKEAKSYLEEEIQSAVNYFKSIEAKDDYISIYRNSTNTKYCVDDSTEYFHGEMFKQEIGLNIDTTKLAVDIVDAFEDLLRKHGILIPDDCREGKEEESCIYGESYYEIEDEVKSILDNELK